MTVPHQVDPTLLPKEEPGDLPNFAPAEAVLHSDHIKEEGEDEHQESVGPLVFEPIPEYWEELETPGPGPIVSQLETPTTESHCVNTLPESSANIQTCPPKDTIVPHKNQESVGPLVFEPIPDFWEELDNPGPGPIISQLETPTTATARESNSSDSEETADIAQTCPPENTESVPVPRDSQPEMTVSLPSYKSPMTSPIDVLTPINIIYSRGVPPPTIVRYEEGEEKKDVFKIDDDEDVCYNDNKDEVDCKIGAQQDQKYDITDRCDCDPNVDPDCDSIDDCRRVLNDCEMPTVAELVQSQQLSYELDPLKMPLKLSFLNTDQAGTSRPQILTPHTDETCAKLRQKYTERLEMVKLKSKDSIETKEILGKQDILAIEFEKMKERERKRINDWRDSLENARTAEISRRSKDIELIKENGTRKSEAGLESREIERISDSDEDGESDRIEEENSNCNDTKSLLDKLEKYEKQSRGRKRKCSGSGCPSSRHHDTGSQSRSPRDTGSQSRSPRDIPLRFQIKPDSDRHVIVVGKNVHNWKVGRLNPPPGESYLRENQESEKTKREEKLAKWFSDTELSGIPVTFSMLRNMSKGWAPHLGSDEQLHDFLSRFQLHFRSSAGR